MTATAAYRRRRVSWRHRVTLLLAAATVAASATACAPDAAMVDLRTPCTPAPSTTGGGSTSGGGDAAAAGKAAGTALAPSGPIRLPTAPGTTTITSGFGPRDGAMHQGVDFAGDVGTPIYAALDGTVAKAGSSGEGPGVGFENWIVLDSVVDGQPVSTVYGHMYSFGIHVTPGQHVTAGEHIADIGNAGGSTGPHLHFEYWNGGRLQGGTAVDPMTKLSTAPAPDGSAEMPNPLPDNRSVDVALAAASTPVDCGHGFGSAGGGDLHPGTVPPEFEEWFRKAGAICPQISPALLAADTEAESGFDVNAMSDRNAGGPTQFIPSTWATYGKDEDHNGVASQNDIGDAVMAQGHYFCDNATQIDAWIADGTVHGDPVALYIAAYNAGPDPIRQAGGMPSGGDYTTQTRPYVQKVLALIPKYQQPGGRGEFVPTTGSPAGPQTVTAAKQYLGLPYVWGGGNIDGPSGGGFDCSGLTSYAIHAGSGGRVTLPRTSEQQWTIGTEIPLDQAQPGDLVFESFTSSGPGHVALALGGGQMIEAPTTGDVVKQAPVRSDMKARRVL